MKKIMFNDKYGLTKAVLEGRKTQTRRIVSERICDRWTEYDDYCNSVGVSGLSEIGVSVTREHYDFAKFYLDNTPYKVGEVVAVAQSYKDCGNFPDGEYDEDGYPIMPTRSGYFNKMFVKADLMPHQIRITNVRAERLWDISDEDCIKEGISFIEYIGAYYFERKDKDKGFYFRTAREAYASLIDKVSGKGTWKSNPYVFVYEFELVD